MIGQPTLLCACIGTELSKQPGQPSVASLKPAQLPAPKTGGRGLLKIGMRSIWPIYSTAWRRGCAP